MKKAQMSASWTMLVAPRYCTQRCGNEELVRFLVEHGSDVNHMNVEEETALHIAARLGNARIMDVLLTSGATPSKTNTHGLTALMLACCSPRRLAVDEFRSLVAVTVDSLELRCNYNRSALMYAAADGAPWMVRLLIVEYGATVSHCDNSGNTALILFAAAHHDDDDDDDDGAIIHLLVAEGEDGDNGDVNHTNEKKETALHVAARHGHVASLKALLEVEGDPSKANVYLDGATPLMLAASGCGGGDVACAALLIDFVAPTSFMAETSLAVTHSSTPRQAETQ